MNTIVVKGNAGNIDPMRYTQQGSPVFSFSVADNYGKDDNKKTTWWKVIIFGSAAPEFEQRVTKGMAVEVTGRADIRTFEKRDGTKGFSAEIVSEKIKLGDEVQWGKNKNPDHWQDRDSGDGGIGL